MKEGKPGLLEGGEKSNDPFRATVVFAHEIVAMLAPRRSRCSVFRRSIWACRKNCNMAGSVVTFILLAVS